MPDDDRYSLTELADLAGVTPRTVRYYLAQGLLPAVGQSGPGSKYGEGHLARLRLIRRLQAEHLPLAEIRRRLAGLGDADIEALAATDAAAAADGLGARLPALGPRWTDRRPPLRLAEHPPPAPRDGAPAGHASHSLPRRSDLSEAALPIPSIRGGTRPARRRARTIAMGADRSRSRCRAPHPASAHADAAKGIDRLVTIARELLEEERP